MFARTMLKSKIHRAIVNGANQVLGRGVDPAEAAPTNYSLPTGIDGNVTGT